MRNAFRIDIGTLVQLFFAGPKCRAFSAVAHPTMQVILILPFGPVTDNVSRGSRSTLCTGVRQASTAWILCVQGLHH